MKKMKKLLSIALSVLLMLGVCFSLVGCKLIDKRTKWYTTKVLTNCALENLPKPDYSYKGHNDVYRQIDGDITETVFHQYAQQVFSYMDNKFERLGAEGEWLGKPGLYDQDRQFVSCERKLENYRSDITNNDGETIGIYYVFLYFKESEPTETKKSSTTNYVELSYYFDARVRRRQVDGEYQDKYTYNFSVALTKIGVTTDYIDTDIYLERAYQEQYYPMQEVDVWHYYEHTYFENFYVLISVGEPQNNQTVTTENIGDYVFYYPGTACIYARFSLMSSAFYPLSAWYANGNITDEELANLEAQHRALYPELYANAEDANLNVGD